MRGDPPSNVQANVGDTQVVAKQWPMFKLPPFYAYPTTVYHLNYVM